MTSQTTAVESLVSPGLHVRTGAADAWVSELDHAGWAVGWMSGGTTKPEVLRKLGEACEFPHWYGVNLDAAWDCLTDLSSPTVVVWDGWQPFAVHHPDDFAAVLGLWRARADQSPDFAVVMVS